MHLFSKQRAVSPENALKQHHRSNLKKPKTIGKLKKELWKLTSEKIRREVGACQKCGKMEGLHAHHMIPRSKGNSVYFLRDNLICVCAGCHMWIHNQASPKEIYDLAIEILGEERYNAIEEVKNTYLKYTRADYEEMLSEYAD